MNVKNGAADRPGGPRSLTLKIACKACNEGWMKAIQDEARPILKLMMHGYWGTPDNKELISLVRWIILFNMSYEFIDRKTVCIDFEERDRFRKTLEPSDDWQIAIGYADTIAWDDRAFHRALDTVTPRLEGNNKSQFTAFLFGKLLVMSHYAAYPLPINFPLISKDMGLAVLWPELPKRLIKPYQVHTDESVALLISRFSDELLKTNELLSITQQS